MIMLCHLNRNRPQCSMDDMDDDDDDDVFCILYYEVCMINTVLRTYFEKYRQALVEVHSTWNIPNSIPYHSIPIPYFPRGIGMEYSMSYSRVYFIFHLKVRTLSKN